MLITPARLNSHLQNPAWIVFDCRHDLLDAAGQVIPPNPDWTDVPGSATQTR